MVDKKLDQDVAQFCSITGASARDARKFLEKHKRLDVAIDAYYNDPNAFAGQKPESPSAPSTSKLKTLFDSYKEDGGEEITIDGTIRFCEDLRVDPEDVVLLAIAYELKSQRMGHWNRQGWTDGWKQIGADNIASMRDSLDRLRKRLASDPDYFEKVYLHTFDLSKNEGQRSLATETAQALWSLLLSAGFDGGSLTRKPKDEDIQMGDGWQREYNTWWLEFLVEKGPKGISKDTWQMFLDFVRSTDTNFSNFDEEAAWPSVIDDFVAYAKEKLKETSN